MNVLNKRFWTDLWWLLLYVFAGMVITILLARLIVGLDGVLMLHLLQWGQTLIGFLVPSVLWVLLYKREPIARTMHLKWPGWKPMMLTLVLMVVSLPVMDAFSVMSQHLPFPEPIAEWAKNNYKLQLITTKVLLSVDGIGGWLELVMLMCIGTALAEEGLFRGALLRCMTSDAAKEGRRQRFLISLLVGLFFSTCHFELYGFLVRWFLGSLFVYLVFWTKSIWPGVLAHALNNLWALIEMKNALNEGIDLMEAPSTTDMVGMIGVAASAVVTIALLWLLRRECRS